MAAHVDAIEFSKWLPALAAALTAFVGAALAPMRTRSEKWFDRKAALYAELFEALESMAEQWEREWSAVTNPTCKNLDSSGRALVDAYEKGRRDIRKALRIGGFTISAESVAILAEFMEESERYRPADWAEYVDGNMELVSVVTKRLTRSAQRDLRLNWWHAITSPLLWLILWVRILANYLQTKIKILTGAD
jgi:hypothetical protein